MSELDGLHVSGGPHRPSVEERLLMPRIPWKSFTGRELEEVCGMADRIGDTDLLRKARAAYRRRMEDDRPGAEGWKP